VEEEEDEDEEEEEEVEEKKEGEGGEDHTIRTRGVTQFRPGIFIP
jgi:hypothetical protein